MQRIFSQKTLDALSMSNQYMKKSTRNVLFFMALILMVLALARPVTNKKEISIKQEVTPIVVAIDVSKSMLANDIFPNRLEMAKNKLKILIENSKHNAVGVLLFAKSAFILSPLTQDFNSLSYLVQHFDNGLNFDNGSNIFALLEASNKLLKNYTNKNILILSDGANKENFEQEINYANKHQLHIYTLGLATTKPTPIKIKEDYLTDKQGNIVTVSLNENIKNLSLETKGAYTAFTLDSQDILALLQEIENQSQKEQMQQKKYKVYTELFYYPLAVALFILLFAFSSLPKKRAAMLLLGLLFTQESSQAGLLDFQIIEEGNQAYENKQYKKSSKAFKEVNSSVQAHYNLANSLYKEKKYKEALKQYDKVITSNEELHYKKLHNMGNTYAKMGKLQDAVKMYEKALDIKQDTQTQENLQTVKEALKKQSQKKQNQQNQDNQQKQKKNNDKSSEQNNQKKNNNKDKNSQKEKSKESKQQEKTPSQSSQKQSQKQQTKKEKNDKNKNSEQIKQQDLQNEKISKKEEQKWLKQLEKQKTPIFLRKMKSDNNQTDTDAAW